MPDSISFPGLVAAALLLEAAAGYPGPLFRAIRHPVVWAGALIGWLDRTLNQEGLPPADRRSRGVLAVAVLLAASAGPAWVLQRLLPWPLLVVLAATLPAQRSLHAYVAAVGDALRDGGLPAGRRAVAHIVGRNPDTLDEAAVLRAAIESLAENFSDGVVAPAMWGLVAGLPGMAAYKAVNTADSMIGHLTPRHRAFGWAAARLDDLVNLPASRLSVLWLVLAAAVQRGASPGAALRAVRRDARQHRSPNAGWPEAAMAGALGLRLAGPRTYGTVTVADAWMGDGRAEATLDDLRRALALYRTACAMQVGAILLLWAVVSVRG
ncbi:MAG: adenosylcobinamide-phosphate synthase CbiB [Janthinobacterium lividum]